VAAVSEQRVRFRLGLFVLGSLVLLAVLVTVFGGLPDLFKRWNHYTVTFDDATGVAPGTPVRRAGVRIGEVEGVGLDEETGKALVGIKVDDRYPVRKDEQPVLVRGLIGGDTSIDFVRRRPQKGRPDATPVEPGSTLAGGGAADPGNMAREAAKLLPPARETLEEMEKVLVRLDKMMPLLEDTLREFRATAKVGREAVPALRSAAEEIRGVAKVGREAVPSFKAAADELRELSRTTREAIPSLKAAGEEVRELAKSGRATLPELRRTNAELQAAARSWGKAGDRVDALLKANEAKINQSLDRLNEALKQASVMFSEENQKNFSSSLRRSNEMLGRANVVMDDLQKASKPLADRTPAILRNLDEGTDRLNRALGDLRELFRMTAQSNGTLQRLLTDPSLYNRLDEAACMVTRVLPRVDRILQDVEVFADRIARHPEALGLGGVVHPSTGLKAAPSPPPSYYHP
jgi:phospholipid/cholesterol/gamma-HCH transport system substrate-binding protein